MYLKKTCPAFGFGDFLAREHAFGLMPLPPLGDDLAVVDGGVDVFFRKREMPAVTLEYDDAPSLALSGQRGNSSAPSTVMA